MDQLILCIAMVLGPQNYKIAKAKYEPADTMHSYGPRSYKVQDSQG